jgi:hypothetical protein
MNYYCAADLAAAEAWAAQAQGDDAQMDTSTLL